MKNYLNIILLLCGTSCIFAQETSLRDEFVSSFKKESMSIGALLQIVGDVQSTRTAPGQNGFSVANFRLKLHGKLDGDFSYFVQSSFLKNPAILDGFMSYKAAKGFSVDAGLMKVPYSKEYLTSAADIDFVNRSQAVSSLNLGRQVGIKANSTFGEGLLRINAGVFNGNTGAAGNDNNDFLFAGRVSVFPLSAASSGTLEVGINGGRSHDKAVTAVGTPFNGIRNIAGADFRYTRESVLFSGEYVFTEYQTAGISRTPEGFHLTGGYMLTQKSQVLLRYDSFRSGGFGPDSDQFIAGVNIWPTSVTGLQINVIVPRLNTAANKPQLLINSQVSL